MKVIVDTNWLISYLIKQEAGNLKFLLLKALEFIRNFVKRAEFADIKTVITVCRDSKDNYQLALAKDAGADFLITGDKDLLELKQFEGTQIVTLNQLLKIIQNNH